MGIAKKGLEPNPHETPGRQQKTLTAVHFGRGLLRGKKRKLEKERSTTPAI